MTAECVLYLVSCGVAAACAGYLVLEPRYADGVIGKVGLIAIMAGSLAVLVNTADGWQYVVQRSTLLTQAGAAALLSWRVLRFRREGR